MSSRPAVRQLGRLSEISQVAAKHGFGYFFDTHRPHGMRSRRARGSRHLARTARTAASASGRCSTSSGRPSSSSASCSRRARTSSRPTSSSSSRRSRTTSRPFPYSRGRARHPGGARPDHRAALPRLRGDAGRGGVDRPGAPGDAAQRAPRRGEGAATGRAAADRGRPRADVPGRAARPRPRQGARVHRHRLARRRVRAHDPPGARLPHGGAQRRAVPPQLRRASARARSARLLELLALAGAHARAPRGRAASGPRHRHVLAWRSGGGSPI